MIDLEEEQDLLARDRLTGLEVRVALLEAALAQMLGDGALLPSPDHFARTQKMVSLSTSRPIGAPGPKPGVDSLGITAAFASLDGRVAEAAEAESALARRPDLAPIVEIDPSLIEDAFALRAAPAPRPPVRIRQTLRLRCALEESHPSIVRKIEATWRSREGREYLQKLIISDRGDRAGFDPAVMSELLFLSEIIDEPVSTDAWTANSRLV